jgi:beta-carotene hydroxylase
VAGSLPKALGNRADLQTLAYMLLATVLVVVQWQATQLNIGMYLLTLLLAFATSIMNHNHRHLPMWRSRWLNRLSDCWFTLFLGHPGFVFDVCHERNHHRYRNSEQDWTRTWRVRDDNCLIGFLRHPLDCAITLRPHIGAYLRAVRLHSPLVWRWICAQYLLLAVALVVAFVLDPLKALVLVVVPQLTALFFLLAANYLQHAHTDENSCATHSRNFLGLLNPLFFNIGITARTICAAPCIGVSYPSFTPVSPTPWIPVCWSRVCCAILRVFVLAEPVLSNETQPVLSNWPPPEPRPTNG